MEIKQVNVMGMDLDEIMHESCIATVGTGDDWATIYSIESKEKRQGHAKELLIEARKHYEDQGKKFGCSVALNQAMKNLLIKLNIPEYK